MLPDKKGQGEKKRVLFEDYPFVLLFKFLVKTVNTTYFFYCSATEVKEKMQKVES